MTKHADNDKNINGRTTKCSTENTMPLQKKMHTYENACVARNKHKD